MTRDDIRKLIGGYATGTLSESERKLLFEAALDDQELFDELAREQALKEMLDEPGAKTRLMSRLTSRLADAQPAPAWWKRPVAWSVTALLAAAAVTIIWLKPGRPEMSKPAEVAEVRPAPMAPAPVPAPEAKSANQPARTIAPAAPPSQLEKRAEVRRDVSGSAAPPEVATQNAVAAGALKQEAEKKEVSTREKDADQKADAEQKSKRVEQVAAAGQQFAESAPPSPSTQSTVEVSAGQVAPQAPAFQPSAGFGGGGARISTLAAKRGAARPRFGFDYSIGENRNLVIKAAAAGYLSVVSQSAIFPAAGDGHVAAGSTTNVAIPADLGSVVIVFSAAPQKTQTVLADAVSSVRDARAGTVEDPSPSANSKLVIELKIQP